MNKYRVNISFSYEVDAEDEGDAQDQALDCADWGDADFDIEEIEEDIDESR
jgi:hypothetical protein